MSDGVIIARFRGEDRNGTVHGGAIDLAAIGIPEFVKTRFDAGWRWLDVTFGSELVAQIDKSDRRRVWWADGSLS